jgi:2',3'-cyclic-nucleotide 2'-phosphodiesterase (5'-nucleotidase family)
MRRFYTQILVLLSIFLAYSTLEAVKVTVIHTNDSHTNLLPGGPRDQQLQAHIGGIAKFATVIGISKAQPENPIVLYSGDFSIGDIMYCKYLGAAELQLMSGIGVDAITLGNHEFDLTPYYLDSSIYYGKMNPKMQILSANGNFDAVPGLKSKVIPDTIFVRDGVKIGVFGMTTPETMMLSQPDPVIFPMDAKLVQSKVIEEVTKLKKAECEVVIMLSHMGYENDVALAQIPEINAIVGGHDHFLLKTPTIINNCYVVQVGAFYENAGKFEFDVSNGKVTDVKWSLIPLDENVPEAGSIVDILNGMKAEVESTYGSIAPVYSAKIADVAETLEETPIDLLKDGYNDAPVANLVADAFKAWGGTDIGLTACGMTSHKLYKGPIVGADIYRMIGYGFNTKNTLGYRMVKFEMTGTDIMKGLQFGLLKITTTDDFLLQGSNLTYGYKFIQQEGHPLNNRGMLLWAKIGGQPIDPNKWYSITSQEGILKFLELLKSGAFGEEWKVDYRNLQPEEQLTEYMVLVGYFTQLKIISKPQGMRVLEVQESEEIATLENVKIYPNPCMTEASFDFNIDKSGLFSISIFNQNGEIIRNLGLEMLAEGLNSRTISTEKLNSGVYTYVVTNGTQKIIGRFVVVK